MGVTSEIAFNVKRALGTGRNLKFQVESRQHGEQGLDAGGWVAGLNQGDGFLSQPGLGPQGLLTQGLFLAGAADQIADLLGVTGQTIHVIVMRQTR